MTIPRATASGGAGDRAPTDRVAPKRVARIAGGLAAVYVLVLTAVMPLPDRAVALLGGPRGIARRGGLRLRWRPPAGLELAALQARFDTRGFASNLRRDGDAMIVDVPGVSELSATSVAAQIGMGGLEFREVIESEAAAELVNLGLVHDGRRVTGADVTLEVDRWYAETASRTLDYYIKGPSRAALERVFDEATHRGWRPPPHTIIAYEHVDSPPEMRRPAGWRSYFVSDRVEVDGTAIASAVGSHDPYTDRPIVLLDFTDDGALKFGTLTARIVGHKLATLFGGEVKSAPVIKGPIRGGRASITMGGIDSEKMEADRDATISMLEAGALPIGGTVTESHYVAPNGNTPVFEWLLRIVLALLAGAGAAVIGWLAVRFARPARRVVTSLDRGARPIWRRIAWTAGGLLLMIAATHLSIPWINDVEFYHVAYHGGRGTPDLTSISIVALGVGPLLSSFVIVELVACAVPRLRRRRDGGPAARRGLAIAVAVVALVTATVQAYFVASYLQRLDGFGVDMVDPGSRWLIVVTLVAGTALTAWIASIIGHRGIGNGYAVLVVGVGVWRIQWGLVAENAPSQQAIGVVTLAVVAVIVLGLLRWHVVTARGTAQPLPTSGFQPIHYAGGVVLLVAQLYALGVVSGRSMAWANRLDSKLLIGAVTVIATTLLWSFAFARPGRRRDELARVGREPIDAGTWWRGTVLTILALLAIHAIAHASTSYAGDLAPLLEPIVMLVAIATIADMIAEARAHTHGLVPIWPLHDPLLVDVANQRLTAANIPHHITTTRLRTLVTLLGAFAPMMVLVRETDAVAAEQLMREWLGVGDQGGNSAGTGAMQVASS